MHCKIFLVERNKPYAGIIAKMGDYDESTKLVNCAEGEVHKVGFDAFLTFERAYESWVKAKRRKMAGLQRCADQLEGMHADYEMRLEARGACAEAE